MTSKRQKLDDSMSFFRVQEELQEQNKLIQSFKEDLDKKLDQKLAELRQIERNIQESVKSSI